MLVNAAIRAKQLLENGWSKRDAKAPQKPEEVKKPNVVDKYPYSIFGTQLGYLPEEEQISQDSAHRPK